MKTQILVRKVQYLLGMLLAILFQSLLMASADPIAPLPDLTATTANGPDVPDFASVDTAVLDYMHRRHTPGGAVAIVKDGRLVYVRGYGWADVERRVPVQPASLFRIASLSKAITSAAIMTLVQQGRLDLDAPAFPMLHLSPVLAPGTLVDARLMRITVRQLLHHTGGWDREKSGDPMFQSVKIAGTVGVPAPADQDAIIRYMMGRPLDFAPGTRFVYSNFGYCVLGRVIEQVSGMPYEQYVRQNVLRPLGIVGIRQGRTRLQNAAPGEVRYYEPHTHLVRSVFPDDGDQPVPICYGGFDLEAMDSHGAWLSSAVDLARFASCLDDLSRSGLLTPSVAALLAERPAAPVSVEPDGTPSATYYGCGWLVRPVVRGGANFWHDGSLPGTFTYIVRRADGVTWVALFNQRSESKTPPDDEIDALLNRAVDAVPHWPATDLFPAFAATPSADPGSALRPGEIGLAGTITKVSLGERRLWLSVRTVTLADGTVTDLSAPRPKVILFGTVTPVSAKDGTPTVSSVLQAGVMLHVIGSDRGLSKPLTARVLLLP